LLLNSEANEERSIDALEKAGLVLIAQKPELTLWRKRDTEILTTNDIDDSFRTISLDQDNVVWIEELRQAMRATTPLSRVWLISNRIDNGIIGFFNCLRREPDSQSIR
jgi:hypothetical protein